MITSVEFLNSGSNASHSQTHISPQKALPLMVNDSSFSFDLTHKSYDRGFCLSVTVVILVWRSWLVVNCVGVHVSCHVCTAGVSFVQPFLGMAVLRYWPQENEKHLFLFSPSFPLSEPACLNLSPLLCYYCFMRLRSLCELQLRSFKGLYRCFCMV